MIDATPAVSTSRKPRGEYAKSEATRNAILDAALAVFSESGYRSGSLREVAARVQMSEAGLLHHFRNKSTLLRAVLDHRDELSRAIVDVERADGIESLRGLITLARFNASTPGVVELYTTLSAEATSPDHPAHDYFVSRYSAVRGVITAAFQRIADAGRLRSGVDPGRAAVSTIALMDGLQVQWLLDPQSIDMAEALSEFIGGLVADFDSESMAPVDGSRPGS